MPSLPDSVLAFVALAFAFMGLVAIVSPTRVTRQFDIPQLTAAGRNEVRAVYGGFGLSVALALIIALESQSLRPGLCMAIAFALAGMAIGRLISASLDRQLAAFPRLYLGIEAVGAALLAYAS